MRLRFSANGAAIYQPGATPQENRPQFPRGLKGRYKMHSIRTILWCPIRVGTGTIPKKAAHPDILPASLLSNQKSKNKNPIHKRSRCLMRDNLTQNTENVDPVNAGLKTSLLTRIHSDCGESPTAKRLGYVLHRMPASHPPETCPTNPLTKNILAPRNDTIASCRMENVNFCDSIFIIRKASSMAARVDLSTGGPANKRQTLFRYRSVK